MSILAEMSCDADSKDALRAVNQRLKQEINERNRIAAELKRNNEHMQEELRMAAEFQNAVLPAIIDVPYVMTSLIYHPLHGVSGDVYDFILNREKELSIFLGDATGHGIAAALMTMMVHLGLDSIRPNLSTDETMRRLNQLIASRKTGRSVSGVYLRITPQGRLTVTHAGHPSLIIIPVNSNKLVRFDGGGCALGAFADEPVVYAEEVYELSRGDKIFAYTDAVTEWRNPENGIYGINRLLDFLKENREHAVQQLTERLMQSLAAYALGEPSRDDLTVLAFEYCGKTSVQ